MNFHVKFDKFTFSNFITSAKPRYKRFKLQALRFGLTRLGKHNNISQSVFRSLFYVYYKNEHASYSAICTCHDLRKRKRSYKAFF